MLTRTPLQTKNVKSESCPNQENYSKIITYWRELHQNHHQTKTLIRKSIPNKETYPRIVTKPWMLTQNQLWTNKANPKTFQTKTVNLKSIPNREIQTKIIVKRRKLVQNNSWPKQNTPNHRQGKKFYPDSSQKQETDVKSSRIPKSWSKIKSNLRKLIQNEFQMKRVNSNSLPNSACQSKIICNPTKLF